MLGREPKNSHAGAFSNSNGRNKGVLKCFNERKTQKNSRRINPHS